MATVQSPLLSLGARGKIAGTLVFSTWKGLKTARQLVIPANPKSDAQIVQRDLFAAAVAFWRGFLVDATERTAWNLQASKEPTPMSGFNSYQSNSLGVSKTDPDGSFAASAAGGAQTINYTMLNLDAGDTGDEAGDFSLFAGLTHSNLVLQTTGTISAGTLGITVTAPALLDVPAYYQIRKGGFVRSGIGVYTVTTS